VSGNKRRRIRRTATVAAACFLVASAAACGAKPPAGAPGAGPDQSAEKVNFDALENFEAAKFTNPTQITNKWLPLSPGAQRTYDGSAVEEGRTIKRHFVQTVTDLTKPVMGVRTVVVWDQDYDDGTLTESELAFYAQADNGDLWYMGEYPEEYENGRVVSALTWIGGIAGAHPGIAMKAAAEVGSPSYSQGFSAVVPWTDRSRTAKVGVQDCVPQGCYPNQIIVDEFNREEPGATQQKYYAPGIGSTRVAFGGTDASKETLELVKVAQLDQAGLAAARVAALQLDASARQHSREAYAQSAPIERPPGT
jgi:hypothetical protein